MSSVKEVIDNYNLKVAINVGWCFGIPCDQVLMAIKGMRENGGKGHFTNNLETTTDYLSSLPKEDLKDFLDVI